MEKELTREMKVMVQAHDISGREFWDSMLYSQYRPSQRSAAYQQHVDMVYERLMAAGSQGIEPKDFKPCAYDTYLALGRKQREQKTA